MSSVVASAIPQGTLTIECSGAHQFQKVFKYRLILNGKTEDIVRKSAMITCCKKIGSKHMYTKHPHATAGTNPLTPKLKNRLYYIEIGNCKTAYPLISRTPVQALPEKPVAPVLTSQQVYSIISALKEQVIALNATVASLALQLAKEKADKEKLRAEIESTKAKLATTEANLAANQVSLAANQQELAITRAQLTETRQLLELLLSRL